MKKLTAVVATLTVLLGMSTADAGIFYGNGIANRISNGRMGGLFRAFGNMERQKDIWIFGRPLGESQSPRYSQPQRGYYYQQPQLAPPVQSQPLRTAPVPAPKK